MTGHLAPLPVEIEEVSIVILIFLGVTKPQFLTVQETVKNHLQINNMSPIIPKNINELVPNTNTRLYELSIVNGRSYLAFVAPPVNRCLKCERALETTIRKKGDRPTQVKHYFTLIETNKLI